MCDILFDRTGLGRGPPSRTSADRELGGRGCRAWRSYSAEPPSPGDGLGECTKNCQHFANEIMNNRDILFGRTGPAPPNPDLGRLGSEGRDAGYGAVTAPSLPAMMAGPAPAHRTVNNLEMRWWQGSDEKQEFVWHGRSQTISCHFDTI